MTRKKHTAERDRHAAAEDEGRLRQFLEQAGPKAIHTVNSIGAVLFGCDGPLRPHQRRAARRWMDRLRKLRYPLFPCDKDGALLSEKDANAHARRGRTRYWRYDPDGRWANEFGETLDAKGRADLADGLVALEKSEPPDIFNEPRARLLDGIRAILTLDEYRDATRRFETAAAATFDRHRSSLVNQLSRTKVTEPPRAAQTQRSGGPAAAGGTMHFQRMRA